MNVASISGESTLSSTHVIIALPPTSISGLGCTKPIFAKREPRPAIGTRMFTFIGIAAQLLHSSYLQKI